MPPSAQAPNCWAIAASYFDPPPDSDEDRALALQCAGDLRTLIREAWPILEPARPFVPNWHIDVIAEHLMAVSAGEIPRLIINVPPGTTKPVADTALVLMADGSRRQLRDVEVGDMVIGHSGRPGRVTGVAVQGELNVLRITSHAGRVTMAAPDHPFLTPEGWVQAKDLALGQALANVAGAQINGEHRPLDAELAGYFVGDGNCTIHTPTGAVAAAITCFDAKLTERIIQVAADLGFVAKQGATKGRLNLSGGVRSWLKDVGLAGKTSYTKRVPDFVMRGDNATVSAFLGAYFECDGTLNHKGDGRKQLAVTFNSVSEPLLRDVQHLLLRVGVQSALRKYVGTTSFVANHTSWRLTFSATDETAKFRQRVPLHGEKADRLARWTPLRTTFDGAGLLPDKVASIEAGLHAPCRCLEVDEDHSFTADDLVVHNSTSVAVCWPAWEWLLKPHLRWLVASYAQDFAFRDSRKMRNLIRSRGGSATGGLFERRGYQGVLRLLGQTWQLSLDQDTKGRYDTTATGMRLATSVAGQATGDHGDRLVVDDPLNPQQARSEADRKTANRWWDETMSSRFIDEHAAAVIVMQRLHERDLTGHLLERDSGWYHLCLPAEYVPAKPFTYPPRAVLPSGRDVAGDPRTTAGELLDQQRLSAATLEQRRRDLGTYAFAGQYQQQPSPEEGGMFKRAWFARRWQPGFDRYLHLGWDRLAQSWDMRFGDSQKASSSFVVGQVWAWHGADSYLLAQARGRFSFSQTVAVVRALSLFEPRATWKLVEAKANGPAVIDALKREISGFIALEPEGGKEVRAAAVSPRAERGEVILPAAETIPCPAFYVEEVRDEHGRVVERIQHELVPTTVADFIHECVRLDTVIFTASGLVEARDVKIGDKVLTHRGRFREVLAVSERDAPELVELTAKTLDPLVLTPNHPVLAMRMSNASESGGKYAQAVEWLPAGDLRARTVRMSSRGQLEPAAAASHALTFPMLDEDHELESIDLRAWFDWPGPPQAKRRSFTATDDGEVITVNDRSHSLRYRQVLDYRFGRLCGLWLAEGSYSRPAAQWSFHSGESALIEEVRQTMLVRFGIPVSTHTPARCPTCTVVTASASRIGRWFQTFGHRAVGKRIPEWAWAAPREFHRGVINGWLDGDGYEGRGTTVSRHLAWGMRLLATRQGIWPKLTRSAPRRPKDGQTIIGRHARYAVDMRQKGRVSEIWADDDGDRLLGFWVRSSAPTAPARVVNFTVAEDESYVTTGGTVHNCATFPAGAYDDQVDAFTQAITWADPQPREPREEKPEQPPPPTIMGGILDEPL